MRTAGRERRRAVDREPGRPAGREVLLTGGTGFIGTELLARYLERGDRKLITLVRAPSDEAARKRIDGVLANLFGGRGERYASRVQAVAADLTAPRLGLARARWEELARRVATIVHSAASVSFALPLDQARAINLEGTRRMLDFAQLAGEHGGLERYGHISTAYVAGNHTGRFAERDLAVGQSFNNSYEQSKFESEQLVRASDGLPFTIMRPSIVVGDSRNGWTAAFMDSSTAYFPYFSTRTVFDDAAARARLKPAGIKVSPLADYLEQLLDFATRSRWGKRPIARVEAFAA